MLQSLVGYVVFLLSAFALRESRNSTFLKSMKPVVLGVILQLVVVFAITNVPSVVYVLEYIASGVMKLRDATMEGTKFVFGYVGGGELPFEMKEGGNTFVFALQALPTVIIVATLAAILTYLRILPFLSRIIGSVFKYIFGVSDSVGMVSAAKIFLGQLEAPLLIKPQLEHVSTSGMFIIISLAFSTTSAAVMPIYATMIANVCPNALQHIIMSSVLCVISTLIVCSIMMPDDTPITTELEKIEPDGKKPEKYYSSFMAATSKGLSDGVFVWICITGTLIGMVGLITLTNYVLAQLPEYYGAPITLQRVLGIILYPFALLIGIPSAEASSIAQIIGSKIVLNEMVAFFDLSKANVSQSSVVTTIYAINNFGSFACIGITVSGLISLAPSRKDIVTLGGKAFIAGFLATGLSASVINLFN